MNHTDTPDLRASTPVDLSVALLFRGLRLRVMSPTRRLPPAWIPPLEAPSVDIEWLPPIRRLGRKQGCGIMLPGPPIPQSVDPGAPATRDLGAPSIHIDPWSTAPDHQPPRELDLFSGRWRGRRSRRAAASGRAGDCPAPARSVRPLASRWGRRVYWMLELLVGLTATWFGLLCYAEYGLIEIFADGRFGGPAISLAVAGFASLLLAVVWLLVNLFYFRSTKSLGLTVGATVAFPFACMFTPVVQDALTVFGHCVSGGRGVHPIIQKYHVPARLS